MLALLLFLMCCLAGASALTSSAATNRRRMSDFKERQYSLSVMSAARLVKSELDGMGAYAVFRYEIGQEDFSVQPFPDGFSGHSAHVLVINDNPGRLTEPERYVFFRGSTSDEIFNVGEDICGFFRDDLIGLINNAFYEDVKSMPETDGLWYKAKEAAGDGSRRTYIIDGKYDFSFKCMGADGAYMDDVRVRIEIESASEECRKKVTVTVGDPEKGAYRAEGMLTVSVKTSDAPAQDVTKRCEVCPDDEFNIPVTEKYVLSSEKTVTAVFDFKNAEFSRVKDGTADG